MKGQSSIQKRGRIEYTPFGRFGHWASVFYVFCPKTTEHLKDYLNYQRRIVEKILKEEFRNEFGLEFDRNKVIRGENGKPEWAGGEDIYFNVTNTNGLLACVLSDIEIGIDAEKIRPIRAAIVRRCCTFEEINYILGAGNLSSPTMLEGEIQKDVDIGRFFQLWTLKESYIKMTGEGLRFPLQQASFTVRQRQEGGVEIRCSQPGFFWQRRIGDYWISLCARQEAEAAWQELPPPSVVS